MYLRTIKFHLTNHVFQNNKNSSSNHHQEKEEEEEEEICMLNIRMSRTPIEGSPAETECVLAEPRESDWQC